MGWIGMARELEFYLHVVGADKDEASGAYLIRGGAPTFGLGGDEVVVPADCEYSIGGKRWANLAAGLADTSYGMSVRVY